MRHCRDEALKVAASAGVPATREEILARVEEAVDAALHNVVDLLEGFWPTEAGPSHTVAYALGVCVYDSSGSLVERVDISPSRLDLPIGYWKWRDGEYR